MNGHRLTSTPTLVTREKCSNKNVILNEKEYCELCSQDYNYLDDSYEFIEMINPMRQGHLKALESLVNEDFDYSSKNTLSLCSKNEDMELNQPQNNMSFEDNHISRLAIPIGPRFQAEIPKWEGAINIKNQNIDDLRWLGIQDWPMPNISEYNTKSIGEVRHDLCSCEFPGSIDCVKLHINERREFLKLSIGTTFSSWRFDEMGETVSKSWTLQEQKKFESLVKLNLSTNDKNLWKLVMKHFPSKSLKCMINYYYNVYLPRRLSVDTRSSCDAVNSDLDQDENHNNENDYSSTGMIIGFIYVSSILDLISFFSSCKYDKLFF
uniref:Uncharacterized protein n=1 Tax=Cajanus cajan TaxID=3821 RepID=A0A151RUN7_CAJCA|nr:hypothetical protein KK1_032135 [Cajanus cajan]